MRVSRETYDCLLDTGYEVSVIPPGMARGVVLESVTQKLLAANGTEIPTLGKATIQIKVGEITATLCALVSEHVHGPMLGIDWLEDNQALWDFAAGTIRIAGEDHVIKSRPKRITWHAA